MTARVGATEERSTNADTTPMPKTPIPSPTIAVTIGRPIASTEPNETSRTTTANSSPIASDDGGLHVAAGDHVASELDGQPRGACRFDRGLRRLGRRLLHLQLGERVAHLTERDRPVLGDALTGHRGDGEGHAVHLAELGEGLSDRPLRLLVGHGGAWPGGEDRAPAAHAQMSKPVQPSRHERVRLSMQRGRSTGRLSGRGARRHSCLVA